jgi:hypothetical protein
MDAGSDSDMPVRPPCKFKPFGMLIGSGVIELAAPSVARILSPFLSRTPQKLAVSPNETRLGRCGRSTCLSHLRSLSRSSATSSRSKDTSHVAKDDFCPVRERNNRRRRSCAVRRAGTATGTSTWPSAWPSSRSAAWRPRAGRPSSRSTAGGPRARRPAWSSRTSSRRPAWSRWSTGFATRGRAARQSWACRLA